MKNLLCAILATLVSAYSLGANYYISTTGAAGNSGTSDASPKATLAQIFAGFNLNAGDTVFVAAGTYTETGAVVGSNDEGFVIQGAPLNMSGEPTSVFDSNSSARWLLIGNANNDNITISRLFVKDYKEFDGGSPGGGGGLKIVAVASGTKVSYCVFDNCDTRTASLQHRGGAIYSAAAIDVRYCVFRNCNSEYYGGAISIELSPAANSNISYCRFYSNGSTSYGTAVFYGVSASRTLTMTNCLLYENGNSSGEGCIVGMNGNSTINIMNCTVTKNGNSSNGTGGILALSSAKIYVRNTIVYANIGSTYNDAYNNTSTMSFVNCLYGSSSEINSISPNTSSIIGNPSFVDPANDDYHLLGTSVAIDGGNPSGAPADDLDIASRIGNPDIGAFEFLPSALPIELLDFGGEWREGGNRLMWQTATETNNDYFTIRWSTDGKYFYSIAKVPGAGNSAWGIRYEYLDEDCQEGINYYVLRQTDYDGRWKDSEIISVLSGAGKAKEIVSCTNILGQPVGPEYAGVSIVRYRIGNREFVEKKRGF